jgi:hypothetical protein
MGGMQIDGLNRNAGRITRHLAAQGRKSTDKDVSTTSQALLKRHGGG